MQRARRINRLESPCVGITFRGEINLTSLDVWREDKLVYDGTTYLVLDFGLSEEGHPGEGDEIVWSPTGALAVEIQRVDPDTGEGLALPTMKEISDEGGQVTWAGWQLVPCSPRRPTPDAVDAGAAPIDVDAPGRLACVICGAPSVQTDADGLGHCPDHVGENPPE